MMLMYPPFNVQAVRAEERERELTMPPMLLLE